MELILEYDMLLVVCGQTRLLVAIHLQQLRLISKAEITVWEYLKISKLILFIQ